MLFQLALMFSYTAAFIFAVMYLLVYFNSRNPRYYLSFGIFSFLVGIYAFSVTYLFTTKDISLVRFFTYTLYVSFFLATPSYIYFISDLMLLDKRLRKITRILALVNYLVAIVFTLLLFTENYKPVFVYEKAGEIMVGAPLFYTFLGMILFLSILSTFFLSWAHYVKYNDCKDSPYGLVFLLLQIPFLVSLVLTNIFPSIAKVFPPPPYFESLPLGQQPASLPLIMLHFIFISFVYVFFKRLYRLFKELNRNKESITTLLKKTKDNTKDMVYTMAKTLEQRDTKTAGHSERVAHLSTILASELGYSEKGKELVYMGALLHDIGKIGIPERLIQEQGSMGINDWEYMRLHPAIGSEILSYIDEFLPILDIVYYHHERFDGEGYPSGLKGEHIPEIARIVTVCNVYDRLTEYGIYGENLSSCEALKVLRHGRETQFDPAIVDIFVKKIEAINNFTEDVKESLC